MASISYPRIPRGDLFQPPRDAPRGMADWCRECWEPVGRGKQESKVRPAKQDDEDKDQDMSHLLPPHNTGSQFPEIRKHSERIDTDYTGVATMVLFEIGGEEA
jgi:hypothetical protein